MSIQTNLSVAPYFDDHSAEKDYYRILFKPSTAVQVRELNQLQTLLQKQTEQFGDHILKAGTILSGCQFSFQTSIPYIKISDITAKGAAVNVAEYSGLFVRNSSNLISKVIDYAAGFEATDPDLNTLYLEYINSGDSLEEEFYSTGELTIYNNDYRLYSVSVGNASQGFSNSDSLVILSSIEVQNTSGGLEFANGTFTVNELITQDTTGAQAIITSVNATANSTALVLQIKPLTSQLAISNTMSWAFESGYNITSNTTNNQGILGGFIGNGSTGLIETTSVGAISRADIAFPGANYYFPPYVTIASSTASESQINTLNLIAENFKAKVSIPADLTSNAHGHAYGVSITSGSIYQKGHFLRVGGQFAIVDKYANTPSDVSVGFVTEEAIVNNSVDFSLFDNANGFSNLNAPGADRLQLTPKLSIKSSVEADEDNQYLPLVKFSEGKSYMISSITEYNKLGDELAQQTFEKNGNFVLDTFNLTTRSPTAIANSDTTFTYVIDPGHAYVGGYRVRTLRNFAKNVNKGIETRTVTNTSSDVVYGNYLRVNEFAGIHAFSTAPQVSLRRTARRYITNSLGTITAPVGEIGKARIRSVVFESGIPGTPTAVYRLYLFDIRMNSGKNFKNVKSVFANNAGVNGVADAVLEVAANEVAPIAVIKEKDKNSLLVDTKLPIASINNLRYVYRTITNNIGITTAGVVTVPAEVSAEWPYLGALSRAEKQEVILIPEENLISETTLAGTTGAVTLLTGQTVSRLTGSATEFASQLTAGDYIHVNDGANTAIARINSIANNTSLTFGPNNALVSVASGAAIKKAYPTGVPIPLADNLNISTTIVGTNLVIDVGLDLPAIANVAVVYNQRTVNALPVPKTVVRKSYIKIQANTHSDSVGGPWCIGHSDAIRLRGVYLGGTLGGVNITDNFYIDHNQNENYYDVGYLYRNQASNYTVGANDVLLVEFDVLTHSLEGIKTFNSYNINDTLSLGDMDVDGTVINTMEVPQLIKRDGSYFDLRECLDFRPKTANTVILTSVVGSAPTNPTEPVESTRFSGSGKKFPAPESDVIFDVTYYEGRIDSILLNSDSEFEFLLGRELGKNKVAAKDQLLLYKAYIPPYPSLPSNLSAEMAEIVRTQVANETFANKRLERYTIASERIDQQIQGYTMEQISQLERRISALEYYTNLSELENTVRSKTIPSSVDSTIERFKFGFFVDNFADYKYIDVQNPEHNSTVYEYVLQPARNQFNLNFKLDPNFNNLVDDNVVRFPYTKKKLLSQENATTGPIVVIPPEPPEPQIASKCQLVRNKNKRISTPSNTGNNVFEQYTYTLSSSTQANGMLIDIKFNVYGGKDRFEVYQSTTKGALGQLVISTSNAAIQNLTAEEKRILQAKAKVLTSWVSTPNYSYIARFSDTKYWVKNVGKFSIQYDMSKGRYLTIRNIKGSTSHSYYVCYPADSYEDAIYNQSPEIIAPVITPMTPVFASPIFTYKNVCRGVDFVQETYAPGGGTQIGVAAGANGRLLQTRVMRKNAPNCGYTPPLPPKPIVCCPPCAPPTASTNDSGELRVSPWHPPAVPPPAPAPAKVDAGRAQLLAAAQTLTAPTFSFPAITTTPTFSGPKNTFSWSGFSFGGFGSKINLR